MLIGIDYEEVWARDAALFGAIASDAKSLGHQVIAVSSRNPEEGADVEAAVGALVDAIVFTGRRPKLDAAREAGYSPAIWIADPGRFSLGRTWG